MIISLTEISGRDIFVNINKIEYYQETFNDSTLIVFGTENIIEVKESEKEVWKQIAQIT